MAEWQLPKLVSTRAPNDDTTTELALLIIRDRDVKPGSGDTTNLR